MRSDDQAFRVRAGALIRSAANDLKRNSAVALKEIGLTEDEYAELIAGRLPVSHELLSRMAEAWPVNERDLLPIHNDCPNGVILVTQEWSQASSRTYRRGPRDYFEYRDTAMSRLASFRPEWIRMIEVVEDDSPENPLVRWNEGHLLYQLTYFVGPVNYYYRWQSSAHCLPMNTGDSVWGYPFSPHSFTARAVGEPTYILALTYGAELVGDARHELAALGLDVARRFAMTVDSPREATAELLRTLLNGAMLTSEEVAARTGIGEQRLDALLQGRDVPSQDELALLSDAIGVNLRELLPVGVDAPAGIVVQRRESARFWHYPSKAADYQVVELAGNRLHPHVRGLELRPLRTGEVGAAIQTHQHQYVYNVSDATAILRWTFDGDQREAVLAPGDSAYIMPFVPCSYGAAEPAGRPALVSIRMNGWVGDTMRAALGAMHPGGIERMLYETKQWYKE